jgi:hypothetical protein
VASWLALGAVVPCLHEAPILVCALAQVGSMQASSEGVVEPRAQSVLWLATGARFGALFPIARALVRVRSDILFDLLRPTLSIDGANTWTAPLVASSLGADLIVRFP